MAVIPLNEKASSAVPEDEHNSALTSDEDIRFLTTHLRGVKRARVRFLSASPAYELDMIDVLLALGILPTSEQLGMIAPYPKRRFGIRYTDDTAVVTVAPSADLPGYPRHRHFDILHCLTA